MNIIIKKNQLIVFGIVLLILLFIYLWHALGTTNYKDDKILSSASIEYPSEYNYAQYGVTCGAFSTAAVVRVVTGENVDSEEFAESITWKISDKGTYPKGLKRQLKKNGVDVETPRLGGYSDERRIDFLKERLSQGKPIILLGEIYEIQYQHYLTVLGFNSTSDEFYLYDSYHKSAGGNLTLDSNGDLPGNRNVNSKELLDFWRPGGMFGFFNWYAIVGSEK
jgi:putative lipoic acid-binding regulatory protein